MNNQTQTLNQTQEQVNQVQQSKGLFSLPPAIMNFVPWIPFFLEMTTGQKIPQMSGTIGEIQTGLQNIQLTLGQVIQQQQSLDQRLTAIENNAVQSFNNLTNQVQSIKSIRLTHDRERKQIEYNGNGSEQSRQYNSNGQLNSFDKRNN
ncbi:hypothetical protein [endosymbiont GvMRE of Glomus versiforme]|uniref:hypothetical protein n=1 Tax=endosymbiont GvMRE of Glomus versiforme TaxID=2039283 RepID=UPI000EE82542|nr:hypothetical protein [endosymbiont GvMRE of Glomus versiforme]RHZ35501.1 hypothetical protein GvMRE_IIg6 [endosymbiont GvMRE of Glomus versiforme]